MIQKSLKLLPFILLGAILIFHGVVGVAWISQDTAVAGSDEIDYFNSAQRFQKFWPESGSPVDLFEYMTGYNTFSLAAPFSLVLHKFASDLFGGSVAVARYLSLVSFWLIILMVFLFGRAMAGNWCGLIAALLFACYPYAMIQSRYFNAFAINGLMVITTLYLLVSSKNMTRPVVMILFGIFLGLTLITERGTSAIILFGPLLVYGIGALIIHLKVSPRLFVLAVGIGALSVLVAHFISGRYVSAYLSNNAQHNQMMMNTAYYPARNIFEFYFIKAPRWITDRPYAAIMFWGAVLFLLRSKKGRYTLGAGVLTYLVFESRNFEPGNQVLWVLLILAAAILTGANYSWVAAAWLLAPLIVFSTFATKDLEYIYTAIPSVALVTSVILIKLAEKPWIKRFIIALLIPFALISFFQVVAVSFNNDAVRQTYLRLPSFFRFANGAENFSTQKTSHEKYVEAIVSVLPEPKTGILLYFPVQWEQQKLAQATPEFQNGSDQWLLTLQVHMHYRLPGADHVVFPNRLRENATWGEPGTDYLVWIPMTADELIKFPETFKELEYRRIESMTTNPMVVEILEKIQALPGAPIATFSLFPGEKLVLTQTSLIE